MLAHALALLTLAASPSQAFAPKHRPYDVERYGLKIRLKEGGTFDSTVAITLTPSANLTAVELDAYGLAIKSVTQQGGGPLPFEQKDLPEQRTGWLKVTPRAPLPRGKPVTLVVAFSGKAATANEGFFTTPPREKGALPSYFTHFEPTYARRFFPCNDEPYDKALTEVEAEVDARYTVLSNGAKARDEEFTEGGAKLRRVRWVQDKPHSTYLVALAVGQFEAVPVGAEVPATIWVAPGQGALTPYSKEMTKAGLEIQARFLGVKYPWARYDQVAVPGFLFGGMENTTLTMARDTRLVLPEPGMLTEAPVQAGLVAHELAHQWFGNLVTCQWWDDLWLNEGFATYLTGVTLEEHYRNDSVKVGRAARILADYFREEDGPRARPLVGRAAPAPEDVFDSTSYAKGAHVLRMLEQALGTEKFRGGLKAYLETYAHKNATSAQFFAAMGKGTGQQARVQAFAKSWTEKKGYPVLTPKALWTGKGVKLSVAQRPNHPDVTGPFVFPLSVVLYRVSPPAYREVVTLWMDHPLVEQEVNVPAAPEWVNWNRNGEALARIAEGSVTDAEWSLASRHDSDPVWRMMADLALTRTLLDPRAPADARPPPQSLGAVIAALAIDFSPYVRQAVLQRLAAAPRRRLPQELGPVLVSLAQKPQQLARDPIGEALVKKAALEAMGRVDYPRASDLLLQGLSRDDLPLDLLAAHAVGTARLGTPEAIAALQAALEKHGGRGPQRQLAMAEAFAAIESPRGFAALSQVLARFPGNSELAARVLGRLRDNTARSSPEGVRFVRDFVLADPSFADDVKGRMLRVLDDVRTPEAKAALTELSQKAGSERLRASARQVLGNNFGPGARGGPGR